MQQKEFTITIKQSGKADKKRKAKKKRLEFMQFIVLVALALPFAWVTFSYILAWFDKTNTLENLSGYVVTVPIAAIIGYITQNSIRSASFNKYHNTAIQTQQDDNILKERESRGT